MQKLSFRQTLSEYGLDEAVLSSGTVIVGFSGGADSSCLLRLLNEWTKEKGVALYAAHINHMIRGDEADRDEKFCRLVCEKLKIPLHVLKIDIPALAKDRGTGLEETARNVRYEFFDQISLEITGKREGAVIATAHNADDNLETVIFNMLRGSGTHGLCGIDPIRDGRFIRPLICDSSEAIRQWCRDNEVEFVTDSTNLEIEYTRNRIRHVVVPALGQITPEPTSAVTRMTTLLRQDDDYLTEVARTYVVPGSTEINRQTLSELHPAIGSRVIRLLYSEAKTDSSTLGEVHVKSLLSLLGSAEGEASLSLPGKINVKINRRTVSFVRDDLQSPYSGETIFRYPEDGNIFENSLCRVTFSHTQHNNHNNNSSKDENIYKLSILTSLSFDKIKGAMKIKYRQAGDTYFFGGMTRKVKKLLGDKKLTSEEKSLMPILCDDEGILWIPGFPPRDGLKQTGEGPALHITCDFINDLNLR
ncbi:MAG: tRNA lysidine(34) synthetase TilS [Ruminococcaceae bacterium]|nr:tRNA lysidine(34) synthetase TilS [Oscillospiraceae bacterium]